MTSKIEETRRTMYKALAALKAGGRWLMKKQNAEAFETALQEHLEEQRQLIERQRMAYGELFKSKLGISPEQDAANVMKTKAQALAIMRGDLQSRSTEERRLEAVNRTLVSQVEQLSHELDVLKMANEAAGDLLRGKDISIGFRVTEDMRCESGGFFNFVGPGIAWLVKDQ